jgi:hypothetical protein
VLTATLARNEEERDQALNELQSMTIESIRQGLSVQLSGSVNYQNIAVFAAIADVTQVNIGDAIFSRALSVGWNVAVKEMKAILVRAGLTQRGEMIYGIGTDIVQLPVLNMRWSEVVSASQKNSGRRRAAYFFRDER